MNECLYEIMDYHGDGMDIAGLFQHEPHFFFLDSSLFDSDRGRYSFIGFDPFDIFQKKGLDALTFLKKEYLKYFEKKQESISPFPCGLAGYLSYDYGLYQEKINRYAKDDLGAPDCFFGFYDAILTIDHEKRKLYITSSGLPEKNSYARKIRAEYRLQGILNKLRDREKPLRPSQTPRMSHRAQENQNDLDPAWKGNFTKEEYKKAVTKALEYIACGHIYQVNLSQRFEFDFSHSPFNPLEIYKTLRSLSPSCFGGYLNLGDYQILSSSPEEFLYLKDGRVLTRPMKGTRPRGNNPAEDRKYREDLSQSPKDRAELLMITDLERNDLGKVCQYGSVKVSSLRAMEEYATVFQATSTVEGILRKERDAFDLLGACFPGGSITGCPKHRAMEVIEELEPTRRSIYTGSLGYINFSGDMHFNILIRSLLAYKQKIYFQVGGGVVADSSPEEEYKETLTKAHAIKMCLKNAFFPKSPSLVSVSF